MTPAQILRIKDPIARAKAAGLALEDHRRMVGEMARIRAEAVSEAVGGQWGRKAIVAKELGINAGSITKILKNSA